MTLLINLDKFSAPAPPELAAWFRKKIRDAKILIWEIRNELVPADLYVYLYAKFGPPNGIQNFLRDDDSDNLIHWEWTLQHTRGMVSFQGMNIRTEVRFVGHWDIDRLDRDQLIRFIKSDFSNYGKRMSEIRREVLEDWEMFLNPYHQMRKCVDGSWKNLSELGIDTEADRFNDPEILSDLPKLTSNIDAISEKYTKAFELALSLRILAPILAESFVNLLMLVLLKPDIRNNERLREAAIREHIDIKAQSLHIKCHGFKKSIDWSGPACSAYSKVINERNDVLHGNIVISKLKTGDIYFNGKVPVFKEYRNFWRIFQTSLKGSGYWEIEGTLKAVDTFIEHVLGCLEPDVCRILNYVMSHSELGRNRQDSRLGVLLPDHVVDLQMGRVVMS